LKLSTSIDKGYEEKYKPPKSLTLTNINNGLEEAVKGYKGKCH